MRPWRAPLVAAIVPMVLALVLAGCDSGGSTATPTTTTTVADPSHLGHSTSTPDGGGIVTTSFPTQQGLPLTERLSAALQNVPEHLLSLRDLQLQGASIVTKSINSDAPTTRTVDGQVNPVISAVPGQAMLLRLGDMSADIWYRLRLDGATFTVLAEDANPLGVVEQRDQLLLPPGKRFDVLVQWTKPGRYHLRTLRYSTGPAGDTYPARVLATFNVSGTAVTPVPMPTSMGEVPDLEQDPIAVHRDVVFSEDSKRFFINGKQFDPHRVTFSPKLGTTEEWTIHNVTKEEHPFHIHVNDFQIMSINGEKVDSKSLRDTVPLPVGGTVVIRMRFTQFLGRYVFHCHILAHEDGGMMAVVDVTTDGKPSPASTTDIPASMPGM